MGAVFWIPIRAFERIGIDPVWITVSQFIAPLICLLPFVVMRWKRQQPVGFDHAVTGLLIGAAFALYCESLLLTDVVRALILFYIMPAWGTVAEILFMGRRFTIWRGLALILSMAGLLTILGVGSGVSLSFNLGDGMAFAAGIIFTAGAMRVRQSPEISVFEQLFAFFFYGSLFALMLSILPVTGYQYMPSEEAIKSFLPWMFFMAIFFLIPVMWGLYWGSRYVDPGRLGILLQLEAVVGIGSAAMFAGEVFGWREALGAFLVISAGLVEVLANRQHAKN